MQTAVTFKARNNRLVPVDPALWTLGQTLTAGRSTGRLTLADAISLIEAVDLEGDLDDQRRTLRHIRRYFHWTRSGGEALQALLLRVSRLRWTPEGRAAAVAEQRKR